MGERGWAEPTHNQGIWPMGGCRKLRFRTLMPTPPYFGILQVVVRNGIIEHIPPTRQKRPENALRRTSSYAQSLKSTFTYLPPTHSLCFSLSFATTYRHRRSFYYPEPLCSRIRTVRSINRSILCARASAASRPSAAAVSLSLSPSSYSNLGLC